MDSTEADRKIEEALLRAERERDTADFLQNLTKNDAILRNVNNPEAWLMRDKYKSAASRKEMERNDCRHPFQYLQQYLDEDPTAGRRGRPVNLFACGVCGTPLWLRDPWGIDKSDE